ncbi:MAG: YlxM family DNA-binding protein [Anaerovoracaceae bacterium]
MIEKVIEISMLYDFYGQLLTPKQQEIMGLYYADNFSLSEIAEEFGISRQGVHDTVKRAEKSLQDYEEKLGLIKQTMATKETMQKIENELDGIIIENKENEKLNARLNKLKSMIGTINSA